MAKRIYVIAILGFIFDQITKCFISSFLKLNQEVKIIKSLFYLRYINNTGASWGILSNYKVLLIVLSVVAIIIIIRYINTFKNTLINTYGLGFLLAGITGNLCDRLLFGYVRDFLDFYIFKYDFPVFNVADIFIVSGVVLIIISIIKGEDSSGSKSII